MLLLATVLSIVVLWLAGFLFVVRRRIEDLNDSIEGRQPILNEPTGFLYRRVGLQALSSHVNDLSLSHIQMSAQGREYLEQIRATLGNLREAVVIVDDNLVIQLANDAFCRLVSVADAPLHKRMETLIQGPDFLAALQAIRQESSSVRTEVEAMIHHRKFWLEVSGARLPDNPENLMLCVFHDVTRQKTLEGMRKEFVANASHELRTPVTVIKGFSETLLEDFDDLSLEEQKRFLGKIHTHSQRLAKLLEDLLLLSRLESAQDSLNHESVDFNRLLTEAVEGFESRLDASRQRMEFKLEPGDLRVSCDGLRLSQVITNLLENVLQHAHGFQRILVQTKRVGANIQCIVEDDGCGIPAKDLNYIFQRFYRVEKGRTREMGGAGLGLSIARHILQQHGSDLRVESVVGSFTRFSFVLSAAES